MEEELQTTFNTDDIEELGGEIIEGDEPEVDDSPDVDDTEEDEVVTNEYNQCKNYLSKEIR